MKTIYLLSTYEYDDHAYQQGGVSVLVAHQTAFQEEEQARAAAQRQGLTIVSHPINEQEATITAIPLYP